MEPSDESEPVHGSHNGNAIHSIAARAEQKVRVLGESAKAEAGQRVHQIGGRAQERIDAERARVAMRIDEAATKLRERGDSAGSIGHTAGEQIATRMEAAAGYLEHHQTEEIAVDVATYVKQHPVQSVVAAAVVGYLFGRLAA